MICQSAPRCSTLPPHPPPPPRCLFLVRFSFFLPIFIIVVVCQCSTFKPFFYLQGSQSLNIPPVFLSHFSSPKVSQSLSTFMCTPTLSRAAPARLRQTTGELTVLSCLLCLILKLRRGPNLFLPFWQTYLWPPPHLPKRQTFATFWTFTVLVFVFVVVFIVLFVVDTPKPAEVNCEGKAFIHY